MQRLFTFLPLLIISFTDIYAQKIIPSEFDFDILGKSINWKPYDNALSPEAIQWILNKGFDKFCFSFDEIPEITDTAEFLNYYFYEIDLNNDGLEDIILTEFCTICGISTIYRKDKNNEFVETAKFLGTITSIESFKNEIKLKIGIETNAGEDFYDGTGICILDKKRLTIKDAAFCFWHYTTSFTQNVKSVKYNIRKKSIQVYNLPENLESYYLIGTYLKGAKGIIFDKTVIKKEKWSLVMILPNKRLLNDEQFISSFYMHHPLIAAYPQYLIGWIKD